MSRKRKLVDVLRGLMAVVVLGLSIGGTASAEPATKAAASASDMIIMIGPVTNTFMTEFHTVLSTTIKPPQGFNDLLITLSAVTGLVTNNFAALGLNGPSSLTDVGIDVVVLVDKVPASPGPVNWDDQIRRIDNLEFSAFSIDDLDKLGVRAFTFVRPDVGRGSHTIDVQARFRFLNVNSGGASSLTRALIGPRTLVVEGVNLKLEKGMRSDD